MELKFDNEQTKELITMAALKAIDQVGREQLLKQAVAELLKSNSYNLTRLYTDAVTEVARNTIKELLDRDETFQMQIRKIVGDTVGAALKDPKIYENLSQRVGQTVSQFFISGR